MKSGIDALSQREKVTLRLLLSGHDAKSIARHLGLSVHTVNERLRDARRKLGVSSSREAARLLAECEQTPKSLGDEEIGVARTKGDLLGTTASATRPGAASRRTWIIGGALVMSLIIAAALLSSTLVHTGGAAPAMIAARAVTPAGARQSAAPKSALSWLALVDAQKWDESWRNAGTLFRSQVTAAGWTAAVEPVRKPLGPVSARAFKSATKHKSLPGVPAGEYEIVEFGTSFANAKNTIETVVLARESTGWKVVGYFVRPLQT